MTDGPLWPVAALLAAAYLIVDPASADLAAAVYRTHLFATHGFVLWDSAWYGGHHIPGYSVVFPPLAALLGPRVVGALSAVIATALFERLARRHFGANAWVGTLWFAAVTAMNLVDGRLPFGLGFMFALGALLALSHGRTALGLTLAVATTLASPVAGLFLAIAAFAWLIVTRRGVAVALGAAAIVPALALVVMFPERGSEPFVASSFWPAFAAGIVMLVALPVDQREVRAGFALYALACLGAFAIAGPVGGNVVRLGTDFGPPLLACLLWRRQMLILAVLALPLLWWQTGPPIRDYTRAHGDPSTHPSFYRPLLGFLNSHPSAPYRIEIPFTANHWEAAEVAPHVAIARGWERQLDTADNALFYTGTLTPARYHAWLRANSVRYVALADVALDSSARAEAALLRAGQPWLQPVWRSAHWRVWQVRDHQPLAGGPGAVTAIGTDSFTLRAARPGTLLVRERFTPYWQLVQGSGCVSRAPGGFTEVQLRAAGVARVATRFAPGRIFDHGPRCSG